MAQHGRRWHPIAVITALVGFLMGSMILTSPASADQSYGVKIQQRSPDVRYFGDFTFDTATVTGPKRWITKSISRQITKFAMPDVNYWRKPSSDTLDYLKRAKPASFDSRLSSPSDCRDGYVCIVHFTSFATPILAGSITSINARSWSTTTAKKARLADFVSPGQLRSFTKAVKNKVRRADCYYGFPIDLEAQYDSFPHWVPVEGGIEVWFPEYQFGCQIMQLRVPWP